MLIKLNLSFFHQVGASLGRLTNLTASNSRLEIALASHLVENYVRVLLTNTIVPVKVCRPAGDRLLSIMKDVHQKMNTYVPKDEASAATAEWHMPPTQQDAEFHNLLNTARSFETVLQEEIDSLAAYYVGSKGIYDTEKLIGTAERALPEGMLPVPR